MDREQAAEIFEHLFDAACELDEARAVASVFAAQDESAASLEEFIVKLNSELIEALFDRFPDLMPFGDFPAISSTLTWDQVRLPPPVAETDIDAIVLSAMKTQWRKVAMVVATSLGLCRERSLPIAAEVFGARILALADSDSIEVRGDPRKWRHSEVRLKR
jgi:hypothetical protein